MKKTTLTAILGVLALISLALFFQPSGAARLTAVEPKHPAWVTNVASITIDADSDRSYSITAEVWNVGDIPAVPTCYFVPNPKQKAKITWLNPVLVSPGELATLHGRMRFGRVVRDVRLDIMRCPVDGSEVTT